MNRRRFCMALGAFGATACHADMVFGQNSKNLYERAAQALGTTVRIVVAHPSRSRANRAISAALGEIELIESLMSLYRPDSQISKLNRNGGLRSAHPYVIQVLRHAAAVSVETRGAFDVTVQSLWQSYKQSTDEGHLPDFKTIRAARRTVDYRNVEMQGDRVRLTRGAQVTLNGIAQGFATDCVRRVFLGYEISDALIDVGELAGVGFKSAGQSWIAGIQHPRQEAAFISITPITDRCLATSGDYETTFTDDYSTHHIFDPRTGSSPGELSSVSVLASTATDADALSTALLVMGMNEARAMLHKKRHVDALFVAKDGRMSATPGFPAGCRA